MMVRGSVQGLLSPSLDIRGIIPAHFGTSRTRTSRAQSREEVDLILDYLRLRETILVADGADMALPDEFTAIPSAGSRLIIDEAFASDERLFIAFLGPLTDMASAILEEPSLQDRDIVVVWIGGPPYGGTVHAYSNEFNLSNDVHAANVVFSSRLTIWQIPMSVYTMVSVGYAELEGRVRPCGKLGNYLTQQLIDFNHAHWPNMEYRSLGDSPAIGVVMNPSGAIWRDWPRRRFTADCQMVPSDGTSVLDAPPQTGRAVDTDSVNKTVRVAESIDSRWLLEDFFHKLDQFAKSVEDNDAAGEN
jgi:purine nucleosidase